jgi:hypothetical protein
MTYFVGGVATPIHEVLMLLRSEVAKPQRRGKEQRIAKSRTLTTAEFLLLLLLPVEYVESVIGDLLERSYQRRASFGVRRATRWYYSQIFRSIAQLAWAAFKRVSGLAAVSDAWRRFGR